MSSPGSQQPFPQLNVPVTDKDGYLTRPWYRFFISNWQKAGGGGSITPTAAYVQLDGPDASAPIGVYRSSDNTLVGEILTGALPEGEIYVGDSTGTAVARVMHGDASIDQYGAVLVSGAGGHPFGPFAFGTDAANLTGHLPSSFFAAPTAKVSLTASPGSAFTSLRSDAGLVLDQSISPIWTGSHVFSNPVSFPNGTAATPAAFWNTNYGWFYDTTNTGIGLSIAGTQEAWFNASGFTFQRTGAGASISLTCEAATTFLGTRYSNNANAVQFSARKARGTIASPSAVSSGDNMFQMIGSAYGGTAFQNSTNILGTVIEPTPSDTTMGGRIAFQTSPLGSTTLTEVMRLESGTGLSMYGANPVIDSNRTHILASSTVAGLPANVMGGLRYVSNLEGGQGVTYGGTSLTRNIQNNQIAQSTVSGQGVLSLMTGYWNFNQRALVNNVMQKLSDAGLLAKLLGLWVHAVPTNQTDALLNWITPGTRNAAIIGAPTWTANQGFTGDGTSALIDSAASLTTFGATQNNVSVGCYVRAAGTGSAKAVIGCDNVALARRMYLQTFTSGALAVRCNDQTAGDTFTPSQYTGMFVMSRSGSAGFNASVNDAAATTITRASVTQTSSVAFLGTADSTGSEFSNAQISFSFVAVALSATDIANLRWIMVDYYLVQIGAIAADYTVATLPLATTPPKGSRVYVTDSAALPVFSAAPTGGGTLYTPVYTDQATWRYG